MSTLKSVTILHPSSAVNNIVNDASGNVAVGNNLTVAGTATVGGVAAVAVAPSTAGNVLTSNGTAWTSAAPVSGGSPSAIGQIPFSTNGSTYTATQKIVQGTSQASTSGTSIDFTGIPSWVKRITLIFNEISTSGSAGTVVQLGTGATPTYTNTGYVSTSVGTAPAPGATSYTNGFGIRNDNATYVMSGHMVLTNISGNIWISSHTTKVATTICPVGGGSVTLGAALTAVRFTSANGTDTFDAGSVNILYE